MHNELVFGVCVCVGVNAIECVLKLVSQLSCSWQAS